MNKKDRERMFRLRDVLSAIPLPHDGSGTQSAKIDGFVGFASDMREIRPCIDKVILGMLSEGVEDLELGWDYHDPDLLLDTLEEWIEMRAGQGWENNPHSFQLFWDRVLKRYRE